MLTVVMSIYKERTSELRQAIESILAQTEPNFEFLIYLDDKNNELAKKIVADYQKRDSRIEVMVNEQNIGSSGCMNLAIKQSKFEYIARMDADDIAKSTRLEEGLKAIKATKADVVFSRYDNIDEQGCFLKESPPIVKNSAEIRNILRLKNIICHSTTLMRKQTLIDIGGYSDLRVVEDYELWYRMSVLGCKFYPINHSLVKYRIRTESITTSNYYLTYCGDRYIKKFYQHWDFKSQLSHQNFIAFYQQKRKRKQRFNQMAAQYFSLVSRWNTLDKMKYFHLSLLLFKEPRLNIVVWNTFHSNLRRKKI